jgi:glycosyltransferase involved in cell wall biosynthesis
MANQVVLPIAHRIIVHTQQNADALCTRGVRPGKISIVPIGVGEPRCVLGQDRVRARERLGLGEATPVVLFHGNIRPYKGLSVLLSAFRSVVEALPEAKLFVVGQPWGSPDEIRSEMCALGLADHVISRLEYVSAAELEVLFAAADVVTYPYTHFDAQSAAACDAIRYGKAIIVSSVGGLPDLVRNPLAVVPPGRPDALANAIIAVLRDSALRASLERDAQDLAAELAWPSIADRTIGVYRLAASGRFAATKLDQSPAHEVSAASKEATWR